MDDEETNLQETIENDMKNRDKGPVERKIKKEAEKQARQAAQKAKKKMRSTLFKRVGFSSFIGFFPLFIIVFMIVGIVSFITTMPGLVQEQILNKILQASDKLSYFLNGSDYYLTKLAEDPDHQAQKEILLYLDNMGIDPVGFGFAPFYNRTNKNADATWKDISYEPTVTIHDIREVGGFFDSVKYKNEMAERALKEDLILKYAIINERTFMVHDLDKIGNWGGIVEKLKGLIGDLNLKGMIVTKIEGIDDSTISVDRENKQMIIESLNFKWEGLDSAIYTQTAKYNLETWTGRYGMPLEFLLALHIGTMTADLTDEMITNENLQTEVNVETVKDNYDVEYEIKYDGQELPFRARSGGTNDDLSELRDHFRVDPDDDHIYIDLTDEELMQYKNDISINSLQGLIDSMTEIDWNDNIDMNEYERAMQDSIKAFLGDDSYRVRYELIGDSTAGALLVWRNSAYIGEIAPMTDTYSARGYMYNPYIFPYDINTGLRYGVKSPTLTLYDDCAVAEILTQSDYTANGNYNGIIYVNTNSPGPIDLTTKGFQNKYSSFNDDGFPVYSSARMYGLESMLSGNISSVYNEYVKWGITCMLSQIDSYMYYNNLEEYDGRVKFHQVNYYNSDSEGHYVQIWENDSDYKTYDLPDGLYINTSNSDSTHWLLTAQWLDFLQQNENDLTTEKIRAELEYLQSTVNTYNETLNNKKEKIDDVIEQLLSKVYGIHLTSDDIGTIYDALCNNNEDFEFAMPRIKYVIKHWYKDVIFEGAGVNVYKETSEPLEFPLNLETEAPLEVKAILTGGKNYKQTQQPYVVKGDVVTLDGEVVENSPLNSTIEDSEGKTYTLGDGYRITKKLFTQGQYYTFDGSPETAKSIWYAKQLEKLNGSDKKFAKVYTSKGRIYLSWVFDDNSDALNEFGSAYNGGTWNISSQEIDDERKDEEMCKSTNAVKTSNDWSVFLKRAITAPDTGEPLECFYIMSNTNMGYVSAADNVDESRKSVERINALLKAMGVVTIRKPVSFDNTTVTGDVTTLTAFGLLEGMHTESAEYIYRDFKEFLIELGYYTKAEFELLDTKVLNWFIPDYIPKDAAHKVDWRQNKEQDALFYGAFIYPKTPENEDGTVDDKSDNETDPDGFEPDLEVIAPGNCRIVNMSSDEIVIQFDGKTQPEIGILNGYKMIISGIQLNTEANIDVIDENGDELGKMSLNEIRNNKDKYIIKANSVIGYTGTSKIHIIMKNSIDGNIDNIEDYMGPNIATGSNNYDDAVLFYWTQWESGDNAAIVNSLSATEVACGIAQWTTDLRLSRVQEVCGKLAALDPQLCGSLKAFSSWSNSKVLDDINSGNGQIKKAFEMIAARDAEKFKQLQYQIVFDDNTKIIESKGLGFVKDKKVVHATLISLINWRPGWPWENQINESMSEEEMVIRLFKYAWDRSDEDSNYRDAWRNRWNCQAKFAVDVIKGEYTQLDEWVSGNAPSEVMAKYKGNDDGWLNNRAKAYGL